MVWLCLDLLESRLVVVFESISAVAVCPCLFLHEVRCFVNAGFPTVLSAREQRNRLVCMFYSCFCMSVWDAFQLLNFCLEGFWACWTLEISFCPRYDPRHWHHVHCSSEQTRLSWISQIRQSGNGSGQDGSMRKTFSDWGERLRRNT